MDSAPNYASLTPQYTASEVARTEHLKERPRHTEPATFGIFLLHILHRHIHIPRHGKLSGFEQLSMKNPTCRTLPGSQHVTPLPRATTSASFSYMTTTTMVDRARRSSSYYRDMPNGEPAVYKLVTRRVTYLRGGVETVTPKKPPEQFPSNIATGSSEGIVCCLSFKP